MSVRKESIINIIEACGKHGVKKIKIEGVEVEFFDQSPPPEPLTQVLHPSLVDYEFEENDAGFQKIEDELAKDEDFSTLMIEDPEKYEELLIAEKLESYGEPDA